jgi:hypothetical protein
MLINRDGAEFIYKLGSIDALAVSTSMLPDA